LGVKALLSKSRRSKLHISIAYFLTNFARVVAYFGWLLGSYNDKEKMASYTLIAAIALFIISTASFVFGVGQPKSQMENAKKTA
jgi:formate-dependent nitrite reductase membrane component NrfD